ncbi:MAG: GTP cyclohydrolase I FolE [Pseudomonadota bacterium]
MEKPSKHDAEDAIKTLLRYIGENPEREGLKLTPERVIRSYDELFRGYKENVSEVLSNAFFDVGNFQDFVLLKNIKFHSTCEHHMLPIIGAVDIAYIPKDHIIGISKLARVVSIFARRMQVQEKMTVQIAEALQEHLSPLGVATKVSATHCCMTMRGVMQDASIMETTHYTGVFSEDHKYRQEFLDSVRGK